MGDYEHSATVRRRPDDVFAYLADIGNLPEYFSAMRSAEPATGNAVHVVAEVEGQHREGEAWFEVDDDGRHLRWGAEGDSGYRGELDVTADGTESTVTVTLHTERADGPGIRAGLEDTLATIKRILDGSSTDPA